jgi:hypothetical protein
LSNRRRLRQPNGGRLTRPRELWGAGRVRTGAWQGAGATSAVWRRARSNGLGSGRTKPPDNFTGYHWQAMNRSMG